MKCAIQINLPRLALSHPVTFQPFNASVKTFLSVSLALNLQWAHEKKTEQNKQTIKVYFNICCVELVHILLQITENMIVKTMWKMQTEAVSHQQGLIWLISFFFVFFFCALRVKVFVRLFEKKTFKESHCFYPSVSLAEANKRWLYNTVEKPYSLIFNDLYCISEWNTGALKKKVQSVTIQRFMCQDMRIKSSGSYQAQRLDEHNLRWGTTYDLLHSVIIYIIKTKSGHNKWITT